MKTKINTQVVYGLLILVIFSCFSCTKEPNVAEKNPPTVKTVEVADIMYYEAKVKVQIINDGGSPVTEKGICWSTNTNPSKSDNVITFTSEGTLFTCDIKNLQINTSYHVRAYAVNEKGISYGENLSFKTFDENSFPASVTPLLTAKWTVFTWPYNIYYPAYTGTNNVNGKLAAPCGPTTLSRVLAYWGDKIMATGKIDALTTNRAARFIVDLDTIKINYTNLPTTLSSGSSSSQYKDVARIFLVAGAVGLTNLMDVATPGDTYIAGLKRHFNLSNDVRFAKRWEYSKEDWIKLLKKELASGRPLMIAARKVTSPKPGEPGNVEGHWFNIEGYNAEDKFYIDYNYAGNGFRGYFDVDNFGEYNSYGLVVIGFKPQ